MATSATRTPDDLSAFGADELTIATQRPDGTLRDGVTIWVVQVGDSLYIRSVKGADGPWFRGALSTHKAQVSIGNQGWSVTLDPVEPALTSEIDSAYRAKYSRHSADIVNGVLTNQAQAATLRLLPTDSI